MFNSWSKYDTYYIIIAIIASFIFVGVGLIHYNNLFIKFIFFCVICILIFFMLRCLHQSNNLFGNNENSSEWNTQSSDGNNDIGGLQLESFAGVDEEENDTSDNNKNSFRLEPVLDLGSPHQSHELDNIYEPTASSGEDIYDGVRESVPIASSGDKIYNEIDDVQQPAQDQFKDTKQETAQQDVDRPDVSHHTGTHPSTRSDKVGTSKPYDTPININISYITKNAITDSNFAKDDIVSNNRIDGIKRPDETSHHLNTPHPDNNYGINYLNKKLSVDNPNKNTYRPPNGKCADGSCGDHPNHTEGNTLAYSGTGYSYISNPPQTGNHVQGCPSSSCPVSPMEINQHWSSWKPQYLSGDDITTDNS